MDDVVGQNGAALVRGLPLFQELDEATLEAIGNEIELFALPGGTTLFELGEAPDALYFVISGALGAYAPTADGHRRLVGRIMAGETVGEMALISGKPRNATVIALRDTELGRLSRAAFERLMLLHPQGLLCISRLMVQRLESVQRQVRGRRTIPRTFAILPHDPGVASTEFAATLVRYLQVSGRAELVGSERGFEHTTEWFHRIERSNEFVVYLCDAAPSNWTKLCLRQADVVLLVGQVQAALEGPLADWPIAAASAEQAALSIQRTELVLIHAGAIASGSTAPWLDLRPGVPHHHVRSEVDVARMARLLTGAGLGIVLSGGGARGFAHIGVLRAIREAGITIDAVGGTSIGAIIAAGFALEWSDAELTARVRRSFVETNPLNDYTLPLVSLVSGRKVSRLLQREFAATAIEDVPLPFFCISTNLTTGQMGVHRRGELWRWLRASVAIPGILPPVVHNGELIVDGASINNLPVDVMRDAGVGRVIGVDVGSDRVFTTDSVDSDAPPLWKIVQWFSRRRQRVNILQILWRAGMINSASQRAARHESSDLLLQPPLEQIDMLNWKGFDRAIDAGYRYTQKRLDGWLERVS